MAKSCVRLQTILCITNDCVGFLDFHINLKLTEPTASRCGLPTAGRWCFAVVVLRGIRQWGSTMAEITPNAVWLWKYQ